MIHCKNCNQPCHKWGSDSRPLYNGNITSMGVNIEKLGQAYLYNYQYDQLNRLVAMDAWQSNNTWSTMNKVNDYQERINYDANGNILRYLRNGTIANSNPLAMDSLKYNYIPGTNQLRYVHDSVPAGGLLSQPTIHGDTKKI